MERKMVVTCNLTSKDGDDYIKFGAEIDIDLDKPIDPQLKKGRTTMKKVFAVLEKEIVNQLDKYMEE